MTTLRLATANTNPEVYLNKYVKAMGPTVRLAHKHGSQGENILMGTKGVDQIPDELRPALLVSYVYLEPFLKNRHRYSYRDWALDSGAFSAHNSGTKIRLEDYIAKCQELRKTDPTLTDVFSLDVIGDHRASLKNTERMWDAGVDAIPTYHVGEPEKVLLEMAKEYPKIALGGAVGFHKKLEWAKQCFARIWPKKVHGLGFSGERAILALPWHSVDATNWEIAPCKFGTWKSFGRMSVRGSDQNLRAEVEWYLKLEARARERWAAQMKELEGMGPSVRLAYSIQRNATVERLAKAMPPEKKGEPRGK